ncbi:MAG: hypothetical protein QOF02_3619 [Blastocatellia bacterium]|nr:hypothetical protein [Blastocatellia bacterium]
MNIQKHIAGLVLFIFIVSSSVYIYSLVAAPLRMIPPIPLYELPTRRVNSSPPIDYQPRLVSLDFINEMSYTTLTVKRESNTPAPAMLWVNTSFFVPESPDELWTSGPVELRAPFGGGGNQASLTVVSRFPWRNSAGVRRAGFYALVTVSTVSADDALRRSEQAEATIETAVPVLVQVEQQTGR